MPPLIDDRPMLKTITWKVPTSTCCSLHYLQPCKGFIDAARAHVGESCSMPSSAVGSVGHDKEAVYCFLFIPPSFRCFCRWSIEMGLPPPLNPGRPPGRAGESTRTPLISPGKLALPRPARGAPLASSVAGFFRETGGQWGPHPRTSPCAPVWPTASALWLFLPPRRLNLDLT